MFSGVKSFKEDLTALYAASIFKRIDNKITIHSREFENNATKWSEGSTYGRILATHSVCAPA